MFVAFFHLENFAPGKLGAIIPVWMMAPKASGDTVLGRHHPPVIPRTRTGLIRTTTRSTRGVTKPAGKIPSFVMAERDMNVRHQISSMGAGESMSQINSFVNSDKLLLCSISSI